MECVVNAENCTTTESKKAEEFCFCRILNIFVVFS